MNEVEKQIAKNLLQIKAIKLDPTNHFTWASGWNSPIYCDNRITLSYPEVRDEIKQSFAKLIREKFPEVEVIAGVATGAIAHGVLVAQELNLPFVYIRSSAKKHGLENQIEGHLEKGQKVVVVEDLVSTGGSSLKAVEALRQAEANVLGMTAIFTYGFDISAKNFETHNCRLFTLSNYEALINEALQTNYIQENQVDILREWRKSPETWKK